MGRELAIALRARVTWVAAALAAVLVGHGFILAIDLFSASSRSALASTLQTREMDPLAGVVRPTLGGLGVAIVFMGPLIAARTLSIEKERRTFGALCLAEGSIARVIAHKSAAALVACGLLLMSPILLIASYRLAGGHVDLVETAVALVGEVLRMLVVVGASMAGAAWTRSLAQAVTLGIALSLTSWAIDAAEGFTALAWLGGASRWSIDHQLVPFGRGLVPLGASLWLVVLAAIGFVLAWVGGWFVRERWRKAAAGLAVVAAGAILLTGASGIRRAYDWTEERRASLPPGVVEGLRALPGPIELDVYLDRDDSRRRQIESDALQKLVLARPDVEIFMPLDRQLQPAEAERESGYGRVVLRAGGNVRETRSTSRRELITLLFEAAGRVVPDWSAPPYPGFPVAIEGARRWLLVALAYLVVPFAFLVIGLRASRRRALR